MTAQADRQRGSTRALAARISVVPELIAPDLREGVGQCTVLVKKRDGDEARRNRVASDADGF